jgi:hypothetical protein
VASGFLTEEGWRRGPRGSTEKPYRATGKSWYLDGAMSNDDGSMLRSVFEAVAAEVDEAGPGAVIEGARMALWLRTDQLDELVMQLRSVIASYPHPGEHLAPGAHDGGPYAMLVLLHRRRLPMTSRAVL